MYIVIGSSRPPGRRPVLTSRQEPRPFSRDSEERPGEILLSTSLAPRWITVFGGTVIDVNALAEAVANRDYSDGL